jgi:hypothetical protein
MAKRRPTPGVYHGPIAPMTSTPGSNPAVLNIKIGQPAKAVSGDGLGDTDPAISPLPKNHVNKSVEKTSWGHL